MPGKCNVEGTIYETVEGKCNVEGTIYDIASGRCNESGTIYDVDVGWETKPEAVKTSGDLEVGETVTAAYENGEQFSLIVVHKGKPSDTYDDSCSGIWLMHEKSPLTARFGAEGDILWKQSTIRDDLKFVLYEKYEDALKSHIKMAKIPVMDSKDGETLSTFSSYVFLPSVCEVGWTYGQLRTYGLYAPTVGAKLDYFGTAYKDNSRIMMDSDDLFKSPWWLRDGDTSKKGEMITVSSDTSAKKQKPTNGSIPARPVFIVDEDMLLDKNNNVIA